MASEDDRELKGEEQIDVMIRALQAAQILVRSSAISNLEEIGKPAVKKLCEALNDEFWTVRFGAAEALGLIGDNTAVPELLQYLKDEDHEFRAKVALCLGQLKDSRATKGLIELLFDELDEAREQAAYAIGKIGDKSATNALMKAINDASTYVRASVATAMGEIGDISTVPRLIQALKDRNEHVKKAVVVSLGQLKDTRAIVPLIRTWKDPSTNPEINEEIKNSLNKFAEQDIISTINEFAKDDENEQVQVMDELLFHNPELNQIVEIKTQKMSSLKQNYQRQLRRQASEINAVVAFVRASFNRLSKADDATIEMIESAITRNRGIINEVDLDSLKRYMWIQKELYFDLSKAEEAYKEGTVALKELEKAITLKRKK